MSVLDYRPQLGIDRDVYTDVSADPSATGQPISTILAAAQNCLPSSGMADIDDVKNRARTMMAQIEAAMAGNPAFAAYQKALADSDHEGIASYEANVECDIEADTSIEVYRALLETAQDMDEVYALMSQEHYGARISRDKAASKDRVFWGKLKKAEASGSGVNYSALYIDTGIGNVVKAMAADMSEALDDVEGLLGQDDAEDLDGAVKSDASVDDLILVAFDLCIDKSKKDKDKIKRLHKSKHRTASLKRCHEKGRRFSGTAKSKASVSLINDTEMQQAMAKAMNDVLMSALRETMDLAKSNRLYKLYLKDLASSLKKKKKIRKLRRSYKK